MKLRDQQVAVTVTGTGNKVLLLNFGRGGGGTPLCNRFVQICSLNTVCINFSLQLWESACALLIQKAPAFDVAVEMRGDGVEEKG